MSKVKEQLIRREPIFIHAPFPAAATRVGVVVPVKNEAEYLPQTLDALRLQVNDDGLPLSPDIYEVLLLVNNSNDASYRIAVNYAQAHPLFRLCVANITLPAANANIGTVRRLLMDEAARRLKLTGNINTIIASTDGDTFADRKWVSSIIQEIDRGADAVGGRILTKTGDGSARMHHLRDVTYRSLLARAECMVDPQEHDPWPRHFQYFGANMAVTCKMYEQAGRLPRVPFLEDMAFHEALLVKDARIRKSCEVKVYTSARTDGRVEVGFSEQLKKWSYEDKAHIPQMVEAVKFKLQMFIIRNSLRNCWAEFRNLQVINQTQLATVAALIMVETSWLHQQLVNAPYFGALWSIIGRDVQTRHIQFQPVQEAITELRLFISRPKPTAFQTDPTDRFPAADAVNA